MRWTFFKPIETPEAMAPPNVLKFCMGTPHYHTFWLSFAIFYFQPQSWGMVGVEGVGRGVKNVKNFFLHFWNFFDGTCWIRAKMAEKNNFFVLEWALAHSPLGGKIIENQTGQLQNPQKWVLRPIQIVKMAYPSYFGLNLTNSIKKFQKWRKNFFTFFTPQPTPSTPIISRLWGWKSKIAKDNQKVWWWGVTMQNFRAVASGVSIGLKKVHLT